MHPELGAREPLGGVGVEAVDVLAGGVRGEGERALRCVELRQDHLEKGWAGYFDVSGEE